ncbi:MAG: glycosyltransferase [Clostridia bacterium]|nr:glycosyltransferase [Clostridia bacterium]
MKVLHLIGGGDVGGAKIHVLSLVKELSKNINVKILSFRPGMFTDDARSMGIDIEVVKTGTIFSDIRKVIKIANEGGYEIIHSHGAKANLISALAKRKLKIPTVTTVHSDYRLDYLQSFLKRYSFGLLNTISLRFIDYYIGVSKNFKEMLVKRKFNPDRIFTVYNGIDFETPLKDYNREQFIKKHNIDVNANDIVVGILARLHPVKGMTTFLEAAKWVLKEKPNVKFLIGGDGEERKSLERKSQALGVSDHVFFLGFIDDPYTFMHTLDINVLTSISESFPYVILEGTRLKKATISTDVGGISDLIENEANGYLFTPGDSKKLAECIIRLANNHTLREEMGLRIFEKASTYFSLANMSKTQLNIYENILSNNR